MKNIYFCILIFLFGCQRNFDRPPKEGNVDMRATMTIMQLKSLHTVGKFDKIDRDEVINGIVVADDRTGNLYQTIIIQDSTGGIPVKIDGYNLYTQFPIGRKIFIKVKDLYLGEYGGMIQLGGGVDSSVYYNVSLSTIASETISKYIYKGNYNNVVTPKIVSSSQLTTNQMDSLQYTLVSFDNMQFSLADVGKQLADTSRKVSSVSYSLTSCQGSAVVLRNSSYASFANILVPEGNGKLIGIYSCYNDAKQLAIRDTSDLLFTQQRCGDQLADTSVITSIAALRSMYTGTTVVIPFGTVIRGTVISNDKNEANGNIKIQDLSGRGITIYNPSLVGVELGKTFLMDVGGCDLEMFGTELEITNLQQNHIFPTNYVEIIPRLSTIGMLYDSLDQWKGTLIYVENITVATPTISTYGRTYGMMDFSGSLTSYVRSTAAFTIPQGNIARLTGYVSVSQNALQITLRNKEDIVVGSNSGGGTVATSFSVEYNFADVLTTSGNVDPTSLPTVAGLSLGAFRAVGVNSSPSTSGRFSFTRWSLGAVSGSNDFTGGLNSSTYYEVTINPDVNVTLTVSNINMTIQRSTTGPRQWSVRSNLDNFASNLPASFAGSAVRVTSDNVFQIDNRSTATAQTGGVISLDALLFSGITKPITFRIYAFNAESTSGTFSLNKFTINGNVK